MAEVLFYHLERASLEGILPDLLEKTLARGWRAVVHAPTRAQVDALDALLWTYREEAFVPHGAGAPEDPQSARQPVFLTDVGAVPNGAEVLFLVEGATASPEAISQFERCVLIFDGRDDEALARVRETWKGLRQAGLAATYWRQSAAGKWEKQM